MDDVKSPEEARAEKPAVDDATSPEAVQQQCTVVQLDAVASQTMGDDLLEHAALLRTLSGFFLDPISEEEFNSLSADEFKELSEFEEREGNALAAEGYNDIYRYLRRCNSASFHDLRADFTQTFHGTREYKGLPAVPYESIYMSAEGKLSGGIRREIFQIYKRHGLRLEKGLDLPDDHLSFELEFMALLCEQASERLERGDFQAAYGTVSELGSFYNEHVACWFDRFFNLANKIIVTRYYQGVMKVTKAYLAEEGPFFEHCVSMLTGEDGSQTGGQ